MLDEIIGKPVGRVLKVLVAKHFLGEVANGLHVLFRRRHAHSLNAPAPAARRAHQA